MEKEYPISEEVFKKLKEAEDKALNTFRALENEIDLIRENINKVRWSKGLELDAKRLDGFINIYREVAEKLEESQVLVSGYNTVLSLGENVRAIEVFLGLRKKSEFKDTDG